MYQFYNQTLHTVEVFLMLCRVSVSEQGVLRTRELSSSSCATRAFSRSRCAQMTPIIVRYPLPLAAASSGSWLPPSSGKPLAFAAPGSCLARASRCAASRSSSRRWMTDLPAAASASASAARAPAASASPAAKLLLFSFYFSPKISLCFIRSLH